jgi:hypothetical protein
LLDPRREHLPPRPQKIAAARAQGLSRLAAFFAATRQGSALIGPSTAARLDGRDECVPALSNFKPVVFVDICAAANTA